MYPHTGGKSLVTGGLTLFRGFADRRFNFELHDFGADDCSSIDVPHVGKKFVMVISHPKMSLVAGGEPAGAERLCQLADTCDIKLSDIVLHENNADILIGANESL